MNQLQNLFKRLKKIQNPYTWALVSSIIFATLIFSIFADDIAVAVQLFSK